MGTSTVVEKPVTLGELVRTAAATKAEEEKGVGLERKIAVATEDQACYLCLRLLINAMGISTNIISEWSLD